MSDKQFQYPFRKKLHAEINGNPQETVATLDGEPIPDLRGITVSSGVHVDTVSLEVVHRPSGQIIYVDGYLIDESDWKYLQMVKRHSPLEKED